MNASVSQNSVINRVKSSLQASVRMLENQLDSESNHLMVHVFQPVAPQFYLLLEARTHAFSKHNSWLRSTTFVPMLPVLLFPTTELAACADFLWFSCALSVWFVFVLNFLSCLSSLAYGSVPVWTVASFVSHSLPHFCFWLFSTAFGKPESTFSKHCYLSGGGHNFSVPSRNEMCNK